MVPVVVGLNYKTAKMKFRDAESEHACSGETALSSARTGLIIDQTPRGRERVDCATVVGVTMSTEAPEDVSGSALPHWTIVATSS